MIEIKNNNRTFINARNQIVVRVRWNKKKSEVGFSTGMCADPLKWNSETQRPLRGSTHIIGKEKIPSRIINNRIDEFLEAIENAFGDYESMKPYIEINDDTLKTEMEKWNGKSLKHEIIRAIDKFNEDKLKKVCEFVNSLNAEIA